MKKQVLVLILALLLASYTPIASHDADIASDVASPLEPQVTRIEISRIPTASGTSVPQRYCLVPRPQGQLEPILQSGSTPIRASF